MSKSLPTVCLAFLVVLAGCSGFGGAPSPDGATTTPETGTSAPGTGTTPSEPRTTRTETPPPTPNHPPDPGSDVLGWEDGYWYNETVTVAEGDGLNDSEFETVVARAKARVEVIRNREFAGKKENVSIEFIRRRQLQDKKFFQFERYPHRDVFWEGVFVVGENETVANELEDLYRVVVDGYATDDRIVLVAEDPDSPRVDPATLAHELSHILGGPEVADDVPRSTWDDRHAIRGMKEGTANFVEGQYLDRCRSEWSCIERPPDAGVVENFTANMGLFLWFAAPYTLGGDFVRMLYERGGNEAIDEAYRTVPASMEMFIHPEKYPDDEPIQVDVEDRSNDEWDRIRGRDEPDEYGESILYAALKANDVIGGPPPEINEAQETGLNYSHPATAGWEGDTFVGYWTDDEDRYGYVFSSAWETTRDAREFRQAYLELMKSHGATRVEGSVYRIDSGPYADAFRVVRNGKRVVVVNAPTVEELDEIHPPE